MAETSRYPLIQASLTVMKKQIDKAFLYERIMPAKTSLLFQAMKIEESIGDYHVQ